ncbi:hypothetical protein GGI35DRAFT_459894, partial [Trichoderma velutinum]
MTCRATMPRVFAYATENLGVWIGWSFFFVVYGVHVVGLCCLGRKRVFFVLMWIGVFGCVGGEGFDGYDFV